MKTDNNNKKMESNVNVDAILKQIKEQNKSKNISTISTPIKTIDVDNTANKEEGKSGNM